MSALVGTVVGFFLGLLGEEVRRSRLDGKARKDSRVKNNRILQSWLFRFQNRWMGYEQLVKIGGEDAKAFRNELQWFADRINEALTAYVHDIEDDVYSDTVALSIDLWKLGQIGEQTQEKFMKKGNELADKAQNIAEEIDRSLM